MTEQTDKLNDFYTKTRIPPTDRVSQLEKNYTAKDGRERSFSVPYLGHADATDLILEHDLLWNWEPLAYDADGMPYVLKDSSGKPRALWGKVTIHGVTRLGVGTCGPNANDPYKELIGDLIRNAAMRFGLALSLWSKAEWQENERRIPLSPEAPPLPGGEGEPTSPPQPDGQVKPDSPSPQASLMKKCREMGLSDDKRHTLIRYITKQRTESVKELTNEEAGQLHLVLHEIKTSGRTVNEWLSDLKTPTSN